jgi:hypothetical protein
MDAVHFRQIARLENPGSAKVLLGETHEITGRRAAIRNRAQWIGRVAEAAAVQARRCSAHPEGSVAHHVEFYHGMEQRETIGLLL